MNKAADIYLKENDKMAGFVRRFSEYCGISYQYGRKINAIRKTFVDRELQNFGSNAVYALVLAP